jgi:hypothetical protein
MITAEEIRHHLQDFPDKNFLLDEEEFTDKQLEVAFRLAVSAFNDFPPTHISYTGGTINQRFADILLEGMLARLYRGKALEQLRNQLDFQDGGAAGSIDNKGQFYDQIAERFSQNFERRALAVKKFINLNDGFGHIGSDYETLPFY